MDSLVADKHGQAMSKRWNFMTENQELEAILFGFFIFCQINGSYYNALCHLAVSDGLCACAGISHSGIKCKSLFQLMVKHKEENHYKY